MAKKLIGGIAMGRTINDSLLNQVVEQMSMKKNNFGAALCVQNGDNTIAWVGGSGNIKADDQYFIASVNKLYFTAVILKLRAENRLQLEDKISKYLSEDIIQGIHVLNGVDYSNEITIAHLVSNTSGIPDFFTQKLSNGKTVYSELMNGKDQSWPFEKAIATAKILKPKFKPGQKGKAHYSDSNYRLLGRIIENITEKNIQSVFKEMIFDELSLSKT